MTRKYNPHYNPAMSNAAAQPHFPPTPTNVLIDLISSFLVPMFLLTSNGDVELARLAAIQTMNAYGVRHQADIVTIAQIVAFGLAALGSLSLSMNDDLPLPMVLRLRGNANACNRSAEQNRRALQASHQASDLNAYPDEPPVATAPVQQASSRPTGTQASALVPPAAPTAPLMTADHRRAAWAAAFTEVANEYAAELPNLPPDEQRAASIRAAALTSSAAALLSGVDLSAHALRPLGPNGKPPKA